MKPTLHWIRRGQRVIRMVTELHGMGYQSLRVMPYMYPLAYLARTRTERSTLS